MSWIYSCTTLYCTALHCTALYCTVLHCTALYCTALHWLIDCILLINDSALWSEEENRSSSERNKRKGGRILSFDDAKCSAVSCNVMYCMALFDALLWCMVHTCVYYRSRIKCLLFMPKIQLKRVCGMVKSWPHTILKIIKRMIPQIFSFLVWFGVIWTWPEVVEFWAREAEIDRKSVV